MRTYYIYKATNKVNGKLYIGQTVNYHARVQQHLRCSPKEDCLFHRAIEEFGKDNFEWEVIDKCNSSQKALQLERFYISLYNTYRDGYNENKGGVGGHNARAVVRLDKDGTFIERYDSAMEADKYGFGNTDVLLCCKNKMLTCKGYQFMFEDEYKANGAKTYIKPKPINQRKVIQCDLKGNFIKEFDSIAQASTETGTNRTTLIAALKHRYKNANGYIFVYEEDFPIKDLSMYTKLKKGRKIAQIDIKTNKVVKEYDRISDAGKALGVNYKAIHKVVDKPDRTAYGYKWISQ